MDSAVVTGAGRGIGRAIAAELVRRGYAVVVTDLDGAAARRTAEEVGAAAGVEQDVRDERSHGAVAEGATRHGRLAVWVNNAGVGYDGTLGDLASEHVDALVDVNLKGVLWGMRAALAAFGSTGGDEGVGPSGDDRAVGPGGGRGRARGDVVNIASLSGLGPVPGLSLYAATKAAVVSITTSAAVEAPRGVRVHALCPDGVDTALVARMHPDGPAKALVHSGGRLLSVDEVARHAVDLVGGRRVVQTLPAWRGGVVRAGALLPSQSRPAFAAMTWAGRRVMRRR
jgi:NAD(P)-dependent dehydrogenase (short-subunit alcohol dehydrogenase family)